MKENELKKVADMIALKMMACTKDVLTFEETALYLGVSKSHLYKLTMKGEIPHFKPNGKMCYFNRIEVEQWLQRNRVMSDEEMNCKVQEYCNTKPMAI